MDAVIDSDTTPHQRNRTRHRKIGGLSLSGMGLIVEFILAEDDVDAVATPDEISLSINGVDGATLGWTLAQSVFGHDDSIDLRPVEGAPDETWLWQIPSNARKALADADDDEVVRIAESWASKSGLDEGHAVGVLEEVAGAVRDDDGSRRLYVRMTL